MSELVLRSTRRADKEGDDHIEEWKSLISEKYGELHTIVAETGCRYFETRHAIAATGAASYTEPDDHLSTIGMDFLRADGSRREVYEIMIGERNVLASQTGEAYFFDLVDDQITLYPRPANGSYELLYIPQPPDLSVYDDADLVDVVNEAGEAMLIWGVAAMAKDKSESDLRFALRQEEKAAERLQSWAISRSLTTPRRRVISDAGELASYWQNPARWMPA